MSLFRTTCRCFISKAKPKGAVEPDLLGLFNQDCFAMQTNGFKEDLSLGSLSLWHCVSVEEVLIYAHTAGRFLHCNSFTVIGLLLASPL